MEESKSNYQLSSYVFIYPEKDVLFKMSSLSKNAKFEKGKMENSKNVVDIIVCGKFEKVFLDIKVSHFCK
jgi:hypothetical protein